MLLTVLATQRSSLNDWTFPVTLYPIGVYHSTRRLWATADIWCLAFRTMSTAGWFTSMVHFFTGRSHSTVYSASQQTRSVSRRELRECSMNITHVFSHCESELTHTVQKYCGRRLPIVGCGRLKWYVRRWTQWDRCCEHYLPCGLFASSERCRLYH